MISVVLLINLESYSIFSAQSDFKANSLMKKRSLVLAFRPEEIAMEVAVSTLSPVSIHI